MIETLSGDTSYNYDAAEITQTAVVISKGDIFENPQSIQVVVQSGRQSHFMSRKRELNPDTDLDILCLKADYEVRRRGDIIDIDNQRYIVSDIDDSDPALSRLALTRQMGLIPKRI